MAGTARRTERAKLAPRDLKEILDHVAEGIIVLDPHCRVAEVNRPACRILEIERTRVLGACWSALARENLGGVLPPVVNASEGGRSVRQQAAAVRTKSGVEKVLLFRSATLSGAADRQRTTVLFLQRLCPWHASAPGGDGRCPLERDFRGEAAGSSETGTSEAGTGGSHATPFCGAGGAGNAVSEPTTPERVGRALESAEWNVAEAARRLGVSRTTIYKRIRQGKLKRPPR